MVAVEAGRDAEAEKVWAILRMLDVQQIVVLDGQVLDHLHVKQIVAKRGADCGRAGKLRVLAAADATHFFTVGCAMGCGVQGAGGAQARLELVVSVRGLELALFRQKGGVLSAIDTLSTIFDS